MADEENEQHHHLDSSLDLKAPSLTRRRGAIAQCSASDTPVTPSSSSFDKQRRGAISVNRDHNHDYHVELTTDNAQPRSIFSREMLTEDDSKLLSELTTSETRSTTRFFTLRRRKRRLWRRFSLNGGCREQEQDVCAEVYQKQTMKILSRIGRWDFNTFALDSVTAGRPLPTLLLHLFHQYDLFKTFQLDVVKVWKCLAMIEDGYHSRNPYHNAVHATDVTQAMHCFLQESMILNESTPMELMTSLLAAVTHDLDHPGVNQPFLIATSNHLAALYKNSSVLENHHWRSAVCCLMQSGMLEHFSRRQWDEIIFQIRSLILATDIARQNEFLGKLQHYIDEKLLDMKDSHYRHFILQIALKCADICNPCRTWDISSRWSKQVCEEFFRQGDVERKLSLPVSDLCDRYKTTIAQIQTGFFQYVVSPLFVAWDQLLKSPLSNSLVENLKYNRAKWENMVVEESINKVVPAAPPKLEASKALPDLTLDFTNVWLMEGNGRRHSVPVNFPRDSSVQAPSSKQQSWQSLYAGGNWATSFSPLAPNLQEIRERRSFAAKSLPRQSTFPPPHRPQVESSEKSKEELEEVGVVKKCENNGCGTPAESDKEDEVGEYCSGGGGCSKPSINGERRRSFDRDVRLFRKSKSLVRLKSDSDLTKHNTVMTNIGKVINCGKLYLSSNKEEDEKENAEPDFKNAAPWMRNSYRKMKAQGIVFNCPRLSNRRSSAPVGVLKGDWKIHGSGAMQENEVVDHRPPPPPPPKRRDSAPILILHQDQICNGSRRGSLPTDLLVNPLRLTSTEVPSAELILSSSNREKLNTSFNLRHQQPTGDCVNLTSHRRNHVVKFNELFSTSLLRFSSGGGGTNGRHLNHSNNLAHQHGSSKPEERARMTRQAQSFDAPADDDAHRGLSNSYWLKDPPQARKVLFPLHRRSSVPTEAWLFSTLPSGEEQAKDLIVDLS